LFCVGFCLAPLHLPHATLYPRRPRPPCCTHSQVQPWLQVCVCDGGGGPQRRRITQGRARL
jgi:hypothetical protein